MKGYFVAGSLRTRLYIEETGNPNGIPLLFIHGISQSRLCWNKQIHSDLRQGFRLITPDLRGYGDSEKPRFGYDDPRNWADGIQAIIQSL